VQLGAPKCLFGVTFLSASTNKTFAPGAQIKKWGETRNQKNHFLTCCEFMSAVFEVGAPYNSEIYTHIKWLGKSYNYFWDQLFAQKLCKKVKGTVLVPTSLVNSSWIQLNCSSSVLVRCVAWGCRLALLSRALEPEPKFQAPAPALGIQCFWNRLRRQHLEVFGSGSGTICSIEH